MPERTTTRDTYKRVLCFGSVAAISVLIGFHAPPTKPDVVESEAGSAAAESARHVINATPFAPWDSASNRSEALRALTQGMRLVGVRSALVPARSGAILALRDGAQRAFAVGQEVGPGVSLAAVGPDHVMLRAHNGAEERIDLQAGYSTQPLLLASATVAARPPVEVGPSEAAAWLGTVLMRPEETVGTPYGWRVSAPPPPVAERAGLRRGDLIVAVNGAAPASGAISLDSSMAPVQLTVVRASGERETISFDPASRT